MCCPHPSIDIIIDSGPEFPMLALNYGVRIYFPKNESNAPLRIALNYGVRIYFLTSESVAGVVLLLWQTSLYLVTGLGGV